MQGTLGKSEFNRDRVVHMMVGRTVEMGRVPPGREPDPTPVLQVEDLTLLPAVRNMAFSAYAGEIVGIYGLVGAGRSEVAQIISGITKRRRLRGGKVRLAGKEVRFGTPRRARKAGSSTSPRTARLRGSSGISRSTRTSIWEISVLPPGCRWSSILGNGSRWPPGSSSSFR